MAVARLRAVLDSGLRPNKKKKRYESLRTTQSTTALPLGRKNCAGVQGMGVNAGGALSDVPQPAEGLRCPNGRKMTHRHEHPLALAGGPTCLGAVPHATQLVVVHGRGMRPREVHSSSAAFALSSGEHIQS